MDGCGRRGRWGRKAYRVLCWAAAAAAALALAACASGNMSKIASRKDVSTVRPHRPAPTGKRVPTAKRVPHAKRLASIHAVPAVHAHLHDGSYSAVGVASWYGSGFNGRRTADGETFNMNSLTAAHPTLPLPCNVRVTNLANHRSIVVRVNDRGPYAGHRLIDVSAKTAKLLGFYDHGLARVKIEYVGRAD